MSIKELENLLRVDRGLKQETPSAKEFAGLVKSGQLRLKDAQNTALNVESRFDLSYNAVHALALAALRWHGYRSESRYLVFQCLQHTLDLPSEKWRVLEQAHRKRNLAEYEGHLDIDEALMEAVIRVALEVENRVTQLAPIA